MKRTFSNISGGNIYSGCARTWWVPERGHYKKRKLINIPDEGARATHPELTGRGEDCAHAARNRQRVLQGISCTKAQTKKHDAQERLLQASEDLTKYENRLQELEDAHITVEAEYEAILTVLAETAEEAKRAAVLGRGMMKRRERAERDTLAARHREMCCTEAHEDAREVLSDAETNAQAMCATFEDDIRRVQPSPGLVLHAIEQTMPSSTKEFLPKGDVMSGLSDEGQTLVINAGRIAASNLRSRVISSATRALERVLEYEGSAASPKVDEARIYFHVRRLARQQEEILGAATDVEASSQREEIATAKHKELKEKLYDITEKSSELDLESRVHEDVVHRLLPEKERRLGDLQATQRGIKLVQEMLDLARENHLNARLDEAVARYLANREEEKLQRLEEQREVSDDGKD